MNEPTLKPPRVVYAEPLPDYSERLAQRTGTSEKIVKALHAVNKEDTCKSTGI